MFLKCFISNYSEKVEFFKKFFVFPIVNSNAPPTFKLRTYKFIEKITINVDDIT